MSIFKTEIPVADQKIIIETGKLAKQANSSITITLGGTTVLVAVCMSPKPKEGIDFFPLMVEYQEKAYAAGKIPGGFFKREGRPSQKEILSARLIDRPIRPLFPEGLYNEVIVTAIVISSDGENDPDILGVIGASAALHISDIPFAEAIGAVRVALIDDAFVLNPTYLQREKAKMELFVVGVKSGIVMIEGEAKEVPEAKVAEGLKFAFESLQKMIEIQDQFKKQAGKAKAAVTLINPHPGLKDRIKELSYSKLLKAFEASDKLEREKARNAVLDELLANTALAQEFKDGEKELPKQHIVSTFDKLEYDVVRHLIFTQNKRVDGRKNNELRNIECEINVLPRTHGSALFTRGQTQSLGVVTLGTKQDEQMVEGLMELAYSNFLLHYNFPPFSVGEARPTRAPGRREIGHGALAAKAIMGVMPTKEEFPYTVRVVSEILESNGSSSMASVCSGVLSLMAAGVPLRNPVAGISIGLVMDDNPKNYKLLTDIMGLEDHHGDMDYKIAGSHTGITAIQLDLKIKGVPLEVLVNGMAQAREARVKILDVMTKVIAKPADEISEYAPKIVMTQVPVEKIGEIIGPGGKTIKKIMEVTGAESIDIDDDGRVVISAMSTEAAQKAKDYVNGLVEVPQVGKIYKGKVIKIMNFGAFCEFLPGRQGLVHVSEVSNTFVKDINTAVKIGDEFPVKIIEVDQMGRINLSRKQAEQSVAQN